MPLHTDTSGDPRNMSDDEYLAASKALIEQQGDAGLHTVPDEILAAATERAKARHGH